MRAPVPVCGSRERFWRPQSMWRRLRSRIYVTRIYYMFPQTDDAYVRANNVGLAPHVSGPIVALPIRDNQPVKNGDLLFVIDPRPYQADLAAAEANVDLTNLQISAYDNSILAAKARETQLEADRAYDQQYLERLIPLLPENFVTANDVSERAEQTGRRQGRGRITRRAKWRARPTNRASTATSTPAAKPPRPPPTGPSSTSIIAMSTRLSTVT